MKTKSLPRSKSAAVQPMPLISTEMQGMIDRMEARWAKVATWSKAKQREHLIKLGALNADGSLRRYPMDHVPLGPME